MTISISVGSGKGGTGKSMIIANLAYLLAGTGKKVCVVDLDLGGADVHTLYGIFQPEYTLTDFLTRKVDSITDVVTTMEGFHNLQLIAGTGETLQTANMTYQEKHRLLRNLKNLDVDVLFIDVGAGTSYHMLDFFMFADLQLCVGTPEPTAIMDLYKFLQLATIRRALFGFLSHSQVSKALKKRSFETLEEVYAVAEETQEGAREKVENSLALFQPLLIINKVGPIAKINHLKLRRLVNKYMGVSLQTLGEIPDDPTVTQAINGYLPICDFSPQAPSAQALSAMADKLGKIVALFDRE